MAITLASKERSYGCLRDAPVLIIELVRTVESAVLAPFSDRARAAMKSRREFEHRELALWS
jgi:hypothetical protein